MTLVVLSRGNTDAPGSLTHTGRDTYPDPEAYNSADWFNYLWSLPPISSADIRQWIYDGGIESAGPATDDLGNNIPPFTGGGPDESADFIGAPIHRAVPGQVTPGTYINVPASGADVTVFWTVSPKAVDYIRATFAEFL
jgi:hypothetical protein